MDKRHAVVIGSGIGGLGITCLLARKGYRVTVLEKNARLGGRANLFEADGFRFDMGPSWYQMPDVWEHFFSLLGEKVEDHLSLVRLDPSYRIYFRGSGDVADLHSDLSRDRATFERLEPGSSDRLKEYLEIAAYQYETAKRYFMHRNYDSPLDFFNR
ncbi:MAG TPA: FAD-dependent oxidoreductase, partial [Armatimonadaceae bacterium]|nr:FAD-dependent oxidoreductase [Armatimonadaceae bacterium]